MRKIMTVVLALPLLFAAYGMSSSNQVSAKDVAVKVKPGCPTAAVDATKNLKLIAPIPTPSAARRRGPKIKVKEATNDRSKKPADGTDDCG
jgi:hypothetical protein